MGNGKPEVLQQLRYHVSTGFTRRVTRGQDQEGDDAALAKEIGASKSRDEDRHYSRVNRAQYRGKCKNIKLAPTNHTEIGAL